MLTFSNPGPALSVESLSAAEERMGITLPPDYRAFLLEHNGGHVSPSDIALPEIDDGEVEVRCLYGVGRHQGTDLEENQLGASAGRIAGVGVLIGDDSLGNEYFLSTSDDDSGAVYFVDLDAVWGDADATVPMHRLASSFSEFLDLIQDLQG